MSGNTEANPLPQDFFTAGGLDDTWRMIFVQVLARLRDENDDLDTLDLLLMERTANLYATIRQREAPPEGSESAAALVDTRTSQLLVQMIESLRKQRDKDRAIDDARAEIMSTVTAAVGEALAVLPSAERETVLVRLTSVLSG